MDDRSARESVGTLRATEGSPLSRSRSLRAILRGQGPAIAFVLAGAVMAMLSLTAAMWAIPIAGAYGPEGGSVIGVLPGGPGWDAGIRVGQRLIAIEPGERQEDWAMTVEVDGRPMVIDKQGMIGTLRATVPLALLSAAVAALALLALGVHQASAVALAATAAVLAERALMESGAATSSTVVADLAIVAPALWFAGWSGIGRRWWAAALAVVVGIAAAWTASRFLVPEAYQPLEAVRVGLTYTSLVVLLAVAGGRQISAVAGGYDRHRRTDILMLALTAILTVLLLDSGTPVVQTLVVAVIALLAYPLARGRLWTIIDRLGVGQLRERASVQAAEEERRRLAREIHDTAIQDLAALASSLERSLEGHEAGPESTARLRSVTDGLRGITNQLSSAELEDLGLDAALSGLVDRSNHPGEMQVRLVREGADDRATGRVAPYDVELAAFRVAQEAIRNAQRHSGGTLITVTRTVSPGTVEVRVDDDGVGLDDLAARTATERGHMGLASMRQRAALVDATLDVVARGTGTSVRFRWVR